MPIDLKKSDPIFMLNKINFDKYFSKNNDKKWK